MSKHWVHSSLFTDCDSFGVVRPFRTLIWEQAVDIEVDRDADEAGSKSLSGGAVQVEESPNARLLSVHVAASLGALIGAQAILWHWQAPNFNIVRSIKHSYIICHGRSPLQLSNYKTEVAQIIARIR